MKIQSQFKDYYDFVAHVFGGEPGFVYSRQRLVPLSRGRYGEGVFRGGTLGVKGSARALPFNRSTGYSRWSEFGWVNGKYDCKWLVICGKYYLLVSEGKRSEFFGFDYADYKVLTQEAYPEVWERMFPEKKKYRWQELRKPEQYIGAASTELDRISKEIKAPVFLINDYHHARDEVGIEGEIPILADLGIPALIPAQQMYQEIYLYISNVIRDNPDKNPPVQVGEKDRLVQRGFDKKISFRPGMRKDEK